MRRGCTFALCVMLAACAGAHENKKWDDLDYERIIQQNHALDEDANYTPPTVIGCVDDDLYNCN